MAKYSIADEVDGATVAGEIAALQADSRKSILVVEGASDERFFSQLLDEANCSVVISYGWENAVNGLMIVRANSRVGVIVVLDLDYRGVLQTVIADPDIIFTNEHDIEVTMFTSAAFEKVLGEYGTQGKILAATSNGISAREFIFEIARPIGALRLYAQERGIALDFNKYDYRHISLTMKIDINNLIYTIFARSRIPLQAHPDVAAFIASKISTVPDHYLCCGHDVCAAFGRGLQSKFGSQNARFVTGTMIERYLRLAYGVAEFLHTHLHREIKNWELRNTPYRVLRM